jgi:hypothetical protein
MMSDEPSDEYKAIQARLKQRGATARCPFCRHEEWIGMGIGRPDTLTLLSDTNEEGEPNAYPVFGMYCNKCGFVRLHHRAVLE